MIPLLQRYVSNSLDVNLPPLSVRRTLMHLLVWFSTMLWKLLNFSRTSCLWLRKYTKLFLDLSSMKVTKYLFSPIDFELIGPHTSLWTISRRSFAHVAPSVGNVFRCCFP